MALQGGVTYLFTDGRNSNNNISVTGTQIPSLNAWHHIVFVFDGVSSWSYYLDGALSKSGSFPTAINTLSRELVIGARIPVNSTTDTAYADFDGFLDEVRIYNRALTATEVTALYRP
jgi:hypothetical protein